MKKFFTLFAVALLAFAAQANGYDTNPCLPQAGIASEDDTEQCVRPESCYEITGIAEAKVIITNNEEGATVVFDVYRDNELIWKGSFKGYELNFYVFGNGNYEVYSFAKKEGKADSPDGGVFFLIWDGPTDPTGINDRVNGNESNPCQLQTDFAIEGKGEECQRPNSAYKIPGDETATVTVLNCEEGATLVFNVYRDDELIWKGSLDGEELSFDVVGYGEYVVHAIAKKEGKADSPDGGVFFSLIQDSDGVSELVNGKQVANVRYYNIAGQEMPESNGMTIVVTTYTDGTTSTTKVVK